MNFAYDTHEVRVVFGAGSLTSLPDELERCGLRKVMLLTTPRRSPDRDNVLTLLGARLGHDPRAIPRPDLVLVDVDDGRVLGGAVIAGP